MKKGMKIQDELKNDRLAVDYEKPLVFIRQDLYRELLDTTMTPHAIKAMKAAWWRKLIVRTVAKLFPRWWDKYIMDMQFRFYMNRLMDHVNEERIKSMGMVPEAVVNVLDFVVADEEAKPIWIGAYVKETGEFYLRQALR